MMKHDRVARPLPAHDLVDQLVVQGAVLGRSESHQSARMPAVCMTSAHFLRSATIMLLRSAGEPVNPFMALSVKRFCTSGLITAAPSALFHVPTRSAGRPLGPNTANQFTTS